MDYSHSPSCIDNDDAPERKAGFSNEIFPVVFDEVFKRFAKAAEYIETSPVPKASVKFKKQGRVGRGWRKREKRKQSVE